MRLLLAAGMLALAFIDPNEAQTAAPSFEVASVKPTGATTGYIRTDPGRLTARGRTLASLILRAYSLQNYQLIYSPGISLAERCNIDARAEGPANPDELYAMLRTLLSDRFHLAVLHETRQLPVLVLSVGKNRPKLRQATEGEAQTMRYEPVQQSDRSVLQLTVRRMQLSSLASFLGGQLGRPVLDETGLRGEFDFNLELTSTAPVSNDGSTGVKSTAVDASSVVAAIRSDLGLVLGSQKRSIDVVIVDHVEKLSAN